jgi:cytochrome c553
MYTASQLKLFRQNAINQQLGTTDPVRNNDYEGMMRNVVSKLSNDEIDALSSYIATLK